MAWIEVNGVKLYYETFGEDSPSRPPILLIHGATGTGRSNWSYVAPLLGREYRVIVPDCRGHGQSENPGNSYSFKEMAADMAALIRALGFPRAHIIGHSNGGNVALVTLVEHPDVVQTAILQAANAYVSPDLVEKEPPAFDPERVARESPEWVDKMISLHGETHGRDYWRSLLQMTVQEIISEPNYSPEELKRVERPTLVIMGEQDRVNAPARHAQYIAENIPAAELWIPSGIGHNVHDEILFAWIERVQDFLTRRGSEAGDALYRLACKMYGHGGSNPNIDPSGSPPCPYPDRRTTVFEVSVAPASPQEAQGVKLSGRVLTAGQRQAALEALGDKVVSDELQVLLDDATPWALVRRGVTDLRKGPGNHAERLSQALLGEAVRVLEDQGDWAFVRLEHDGYLGWIQTRALHRCSREEVAGYWERFAALVVAEILPSYAGLSTVQVDSHPEAGKLPFGIPVAVLQERDGLVELDLPGGERWWVDASALLPLDRRPRPDEGGISRSLSLFRRFVGVPYLWGGRTPFGFDCSGLAQAFWGFMGVRTPRDADQQFQAGIPVEGTPQPGDLLFFGETGGEGARHSVTHVAISLGDWEILHANGTTWSVAYNSLEPGRTNFNAWLRYHLLGIRRFV